jgi:hypothetical protein
VSALFTPVQARSRHHGSSGLKGIARDRLRSPAQVEIALRITDGDPTKIAPMVNEVISQRVDVSVANGPPARQSNKQKQMDQRECWPNLPRQAA